MSRYTPTTEQVRSVFARDGIGAPSEANGKRFDRWLNEKIRKAKAEALREAAEDVGSLDPRDTVQWLTYRANDIERTSDGRTD